VPGYPKETAKNNLTLSTLLPHPREYFKRCRQRIVTRMSNQQDRFALIKYMLINENFFNDSFSTACQDKEKSWGFLCFVVGRTFSGARREARRRRCFGTVGLFCHFDTPALSLLQHSSVALKNGIDSRSVVQYRRNHTIRKITHPLLLLQSSETIRFSSKFLL